MSVRATTDYRGTFVQGTTTTLFLQITDFDGNAVDPTSISIEIIKESDSSTVETGTPDKIDTGFFLYEWEVDGSQDTGSYSAVWSYDVGDGSVQEVQGIVVIEESDSSSGTSLYSPVMIEMRAALEHMIMCAQRIPIYDEQARANTTHTQYSLTFPRWNQSAGVRVYRNDKLINNGYEVDYFNGTILFDSALSSVDKVNADYNFRWFTDEQLDRFLQNGLSYINLFPPRTLWSFRELVSRQATWIPIVLYAAARDALRELLLCIQFQQPQQVFGGPDAAQQAFQNMETLKKNYEGDIDKAVEQKKYGPYVGLTRGIVTPEFTLPGGRSRWFRYLFKGGGV